MKVFKQMLFNTYIWEFILFFNTLYSLLIVWAVRIFLKSSKPLLGNIIIVNASAN